MKKEFWIKKDRTKDRPDNWEKMSSYEFARFMETADGKSRKENIARVPGGESGEPIIYMEGEYRQGSRRRVRRTDHLYGS